MTTEDLVQRLAREAGQGSGFRWSKQARGVRLWWSSFQPTQRAIETDGDSCCFLTGGTPVHECSLPAAQFTTEQCHRWLVWLRSGGGLPWRFPAPELIALRDRLRELVRECHADLYAHETQDAVCLDRVEDRIGVTASVEFRPANAASVWLVRMQGGQASEESLDDRHLREYIAKLNG